MIPPYRHWPVLDRPTLRYPGDKRMACYIGMNIEHFQVGQPSTSRTGVTASLPVDPLNYGWRDYGVRVGFWRMLDALDEYSLPVSTLLNADAATHYPEIVAAGVERNWAFLGHGVTNSQLWTGMALEDERAALKSITDTLTQATGKAPRGWLGPALTETENTLTLLSELGFTYSLDWVADDQPFPIELGGRKFASVPYPIELNDITVFLDQSMTPRQFTEMIVDQFQVMYEEAASRPGSVFSVALHPMLAGQPFRHRHLVQAFKEISNVSDVWYANTDEICEYYLSSCHDAALASVDAHSKRHANGG